MQSAYVETAELKGLSSFAVIARHALPNAIAPIVNVVVVNLGYLVVGVVVIEVVFVYPRHGGSTWLTMSPSATCLWCRRAASSSRRSTSAST